MMPELVVLQSLKTLQFLEKKKKNAYSLFEQ